jgi:hypothetical protein
VRSANIWQDINMELILTIALVTMLMPLACSALYLLFLAGFGLCAVVVHFPTIIIQVINNVTRILLDKLVK